MNAALFHSKSQLETCYYLIGLCCVCCVCIIQLFESHFIIISFESVGEGILFYMHSDMTIWMFGTMLRCTHSFTHMCTGSGVWSMNGTLHLLLSFDWTLEKWQNSALVWAPEARLQSAVVFSFCFLFAWAEKSNVHHSCLSWVFGQWDRVILAWRHTQRQLGLSSATIGSASASWLAHGGSVFCTMNPNCWQSYWCQFWLLKSSLVDIYSLLLIRFKWTYR